MRPRPCFGRTVTLGPHENPLTGEGEEIMKLDRKVALVTGGSRTIGHAIALGLAREGADVAILYVSHPEAAQETMKAIEGLGRRALAQCPPRHPARRAAAGAGPARRPPRGRRTPPG